MPARLTVRRRARETGRGAFVFAVSPLAAVMVLACACTSSRLEYPTPEETLVAVDDQLELDGSFCASPAANVAYPVKVMFLVDGSGSQQFTDQNRQRVVAVENAINALIGQPNIYFKIIAFNAAVTATPSNFGSPPPPVFTNDIATLMPGLVDLAQADTVTDYQGTLAVAYEEVLRDITDVRGDPTRGPAELGRTKYVFIFISDGFPDPQCKVGVGNDIDPATGGPNLLCEDQDFLNCLLQVDDPVLGTTSCSNGICDFNGTLCYEQPNAQTLFGGLDTLELTAGGDYNQPYQILQRVQDIVNLQTRYNVGEIRFHAGLVLDPHADPNIIAIFGDPAQAKPLLESMAQLGDGLFMQFYGGDQIDFLSINYKSLAQPRVVRGLLAYDYSAVPAAQGADVDTDGDGLADALETSLGTNPRMADSDVDGYSDSVEHARRAFGMNPLDPCKPALVDVPGADPLAACDPQNPMNCDFQWANGARAYVDSDMDGLHDCEEKALGTNAVLADTDHDGIPDRIELILGLDSLTWDYEGDLDGDGLANGREATWHLPSMLQQTDVATHARYRYEQTEVASTIDGRPCYDFKIRHIKLAPTIENNDLGLAVGFNDVRLYIVENMADDLAGAPLVRTACVRPRYVPPGLKYPATGAFTLAVTDARGNYTDRDADEGFFKYLVSDDPIFNGLDAGDEFDAARDCFVCDAQTCSKPAAAP